MVYNANASIINPSPCSPQGTGALTNESKKRHQNFNLFAVPGFFFEASEPRNDRNNCYSDGAGSRLDTECASRALQPSSGAGIGTHSDRMDPAISVQSLRF